MRILDQDNDRKLDRVTLYLTLAEAQELRDSLEAVIQQPRGNHAHIPDSAFDKEITVCIYDEALAGFDERSRRLIEHDH